MKEAEVKRFVQFDDENPDVYTLFKRFTFEAIRAGHKRLSAWLIINRIRWETDVVTKGGDYDPTRGTYYKISNAFVALYARKFIEDHPAHADLFTLRKLEIV